MAKRSSAKGDKSESVRYTRTIELTPRASNLFDEACEELGASKKVLNSRVVEWFARLPKAEKAIIASGSTQDEGLIDILILRRLADRFGEDAYRLGVELGLQIADRLKAPPKSQK